MSSQHLERAMLLYELSRYRQAAVEFQKALSYDPDDSSIHTFLGSCFFYEDKYPEAEAELREGIRLSPDWSESYRILANCCFYQARAEEGHALVQTAIRLSPEDANCFWTLSKLYTLQDNHAAALKATNQGLEINPEHVNCLQAKALVLGSLCQHAEGLDMIKIALNKAPESAENHAIQGYLLYQEKQLQGASDSFEMALRLDPQNGLATVMIAHAAKVESQAKEQKYWRTLTIAGAFLFFLLRVVIGSYSGSTGSSNMYKTLEPLQSGRELPLASKPFESPGPSVEGNANVGVDLEVKPSDARIHWLDLQIELITEDSPCKVPNDARVADYDRLIENNKGYQRVMYSLSKKEVRQLGRAIKLRCKNTPEDVKKSRKELSLLRSKLDKINASLYPDLLSIYDYFSVLEYS
jgi:tetratricopeptide (TPR) repeat protein